MAVTSKHSVKEIPPEQLQICCLKNNLLANLVDTFAGLYKNYKNK